MHGIRSAVFCLNFSQDFQLHCKTTEISLHFLMVSQNTKLSSFCLETVKVKVWVGRIYNSLNCPKNNAYLPNNNVKKCITGCQALKSVNPEIF